MSKSTKKIKAWCVTRSGKKIEENQLRIYDWEREDGIEPQKCLVVGPKNSLLRWVNKWRAGNERMLVIPITITLDKLKKK